MNKTLIIIILIIVAVIVFNGFKLYLQNVKTPQLGHENGHLTAMPNKPNAISSQSMDPTKLVEPLEFKGNIIESREKLKVVIYNLGYVELIEEEEDYLYFIFKSKKLKFKDDVEFYFDQDKQLIHIRSSSRAGYSDMGVNLKRYNLIKEKYEQL
ncbi:MAG: DUF1499 domain-containing protein [Saccharospirillaceae bacterium]|nr:DUF1499 domain-containing protein [Pseudomonadales bacterium]NRB78469.1 DUF1499 domain-containing protein [Saccharospirillaceae bacterium]